MDAREGATTSAKRRHAGRIALALLVAVALATVAAAGILGRTARHPAAVSAVPQQATQQRFHHGTHLPDQWMSMSIEQQSRVCADCHDHEPNESLGFARISARTCDRCHFSDPARETTAPGATQRLSMKAPDLTRSAAMFAHAGKGHQQQPCTKCHVPSEGAKDGTNYADVLFTVPRTLATCIPCHGHGADDPAKQNTKLTGGKECAICHRVTGPTLLRGTDRARQRPFSHATHLKLDAMQTEGNAAVCRECHAFEGGRQRVSETGVLVDANATEAGIQADACSRCHADAQRKATVVALTDRVVQRVPTRFIHAGHHALIGKEGCSKCHAVTAGAAHPVVDASYGRCSGCHDGVPNHGQRCDACHGGAGHKEVAKVEVQRPAVAEAAFRLDHAQHPAITARGGDVHATAAGRPCSDCHRNRTAELGAAGARRFQHAHHLGADRSNAACTTCHLSVPEARSSVATTVFAEARLREKAVCTAQCHLGAELVYQPTVATLSVARFDHGKHLEKGDLACTDCHDLDADLRPDDMRKADLALCARCHSHDEKQVDKFRRTGAGGACNSEGALGGKGIESCTKKCHVVDATESMLLSHQPARMSQFALQGGRQFHEKLAEGEQCRSCHAWDTPPTDRVNERLIVYSHVSVHGSRRSFAEMGKYKVPDALMPKLQGTSKLDCAVCHRREQTLRDYQR